MHHRRLRVIFWTLFCLPVGVVLWHIGDSIIEDDNFDIVSGDVYRAGQLRSDEWRESFAEHPYRSVLNLRGREEGQPWYALESNFAFRHNLTHYDFRLSANVAPSLDEMRQLVRIMRAAPKPLLIHCKDGADRTGLVAALYRYAIEGLPAAEAGRQLSIWYGHFPWGPSRTGAMDEALADFVAHDQGP